MNNYIDHLYNKGINTIKNKGYANLLICFHDGKSSIYKIYNLSEFNLIFNYWVFDNLDTDYFLEIN